MTTSTALQTPGTQRGDNEKGFTRSALRKVGKRGDPGDRREQDWSEELHCKRWEKLSRSDSKAGSLITKKHLAIVLPFYPWDLSTRKVYFPFWMRRSVELNPTSSRSGNRDPINAWSDPKTEGSARNGRPSRYKTFLRWHSTVHWPPSLRPPFPASQTGKRSRRRETKFSGSEIVSIFDRSMRQRWNFSEKQSPHCRTGMTRAWMGLADIFIVTKLFQEVQFRIYGSIVVHMGLARFHAAACFLWTAGNHGLLRPVTLQGKVAFWTGIAKGEIKTPCR